MIEEIGKISYNSKHTALKMWVVTVEGGKRTIREHRHINFEIGLILEGSGLYHTFYGDKKINEGDIFIFTSNEPHCITNIESSQLKILNIQFSKQLIDNIPYLDSYYPYLFFNHSKEFDCRIANSNAKYISERLFKIREEFLNKNEGYSCVISSCLGDIFVELIRNHNYYQTDESLSSSIIKKLEKGIDFINSNYTENITLEIIAEKSNITPNYFSALFKECLNMKLWDYITAKRIEKAKRMLKNNEEALTVLDIATECGFNNTANFNRSFKLHTGLTPTEYRKNRYKTII